MVLKKSGMPTKRDRALFITRALSLACGFKAGIICEPEISILSYNKRMKFLVLASDGTGVFNKMTKLSHILKSIFCGGSLEWVLRVLSNRDQADGKKL